MEIRRGVRLELSFKLVFYIFVFLVTFSVLELFFIPVSHRSLWGNFFIVFIELFFYTLYIVLGYVAYRVIKRFSGNERFLRVFLVLMILLAIVLFVLTLGVFFGVRSGEIENKKQYSIAEKRGFEIIELVEDYRLLHGSYPEDINLVFGENDPRFVVVEGNYELEYEFYDGGLMAVERLVDDESIKAWVGKHDRSNLSDEEFVASLREYERRLNRGDVTYSYQKCESSFAFYFRIHSWWNFFVYNNKAGRFYPYDDFADARMCSY